MLGSGQHNKIIRKRPDVKYQMRYIFEILKNRDNEKNLIKNFKNVVYKLYLRTIS